MATETILLYIRLINNPIHLKVSIHALATYKELTEILFNFQIVIHQYHKQENLLSMPFDIIGYIPQTRYIYSIKESNQIFLNDFDLL